MKNKFISFAINIFALFTVFFLLFFPKEMIYAAKNGLLIWFNNVIPSLFPFMITVNIITSKSLKISNFLSCCFEKLFNTNPHGITAYVFGMLSGYPLGAKITSDLYFNKQISSADVQKLLFFCCNAGPMFIIGTVACEIINIPFVGYIILVSSFLSNTLCGIISGRILFSPKERFSISFCCVENKKSSAVENSCEAIVKVGGYIILFSVITEILSLTGITEFFAKCISLFTPLGFIESKALFSGIFEMTCGIKEISASTAPVAVKSALGAFVLSFGGLSVIFQSADFLKGTKISIPLFVFGKLLNGILTSVFTYVIVYLETTLG